jgi:hypothetical protein
MAWSKYYNLSGLPAAVKQQPAQWGKQAEAASTAVKEGIFRPLDPVLQYDASEVYSMPTFERPEVERQEGSVWSLCMGLLGQGMLSLPSSPQEDMPYGIDAAFLTTFDLYDLDSVGALVRNITQKAATKSPFIWHRCAVTPLRSSTMIDSGGWQGEEAHADHIGGVLARQEAPAVWIRTADPHRPSAV